MGRIICAGLGPGDPDLISVKADRAIRSAGHIAYFRKAGRKGQARGIVADLMPDGVEEHPMEYPVTTEIPVDSTEYNRILAEFYEDWAKRLLELAAEDDVVVLCEGDPFLYGSFMHLYERLTGLVEIEVIPGIPGMAGCWNAAGLPFVWGDDVLTVLMGTLTEDDLTRRLTGSDAIVVMKTGRNLPRIRRALERAGRLGEAWLVERGTMPEERVVRMAELNDGDCPYFAIVLLPGNGRRPRLSDVAE